MGRHSLQEVDLWPATPAHFRRDAITDAIAGRRGGQQLSVFRRELAALGVVLDQVEAGDIARSAERARFATDIAWPPPDVDEDLLTRTDQPQ